MIPLRAATHRSTTLGMCCHTFLCSLLAPMLWAAEPSARICQVQLRQGEPRTVTVKEATEETLLWENSDQSLTWNQILSWRNERTPKSWSSRSAIIWLPGGDRIVAEPISADDDVLQARWLHFETRELLQLPMEYVSSMAFQLPAGASHRLQLHRRLATHVQAGDLAWLNSQDQLAGEFVGLTASTLNFRQAGQLTSIRREQLVALQMNPELVTTPVVQSPRYVLTLSDGSRVTATKFHWDIQSLSFTTFYGLNAKLPAEALVGCQVFSERVQPLSERKPARVVAEPYLHRKWNWQQNRNILQGPLELRGREYATGLGVHSQMELTYDLSSHDRHFLATVGIDDCAEGRGHVLFVILLDGQRVWESPGLTGTSAPVDVPPVDLNGAKQLTLLVEFGEQADIADYANWCDALILTDNQQ